ncbi:mavicyanin-like [Phalaenopsis equestris]|uniref:mavicyanin-like n=1 Tax=Phalaenopsis equestris TaxID=78828 RepID=UPI0009E47878|nr:mavicyanin-like [Phalaenopsis equestris]
MAGGGLGGRPVMVVAVFFASLAVVVPMISAATSHTVGGSTGWTIPPNASFYPKWADSQQFVVGDTLVFNFPTSAHTVAEVPKSSYNVCSNRNQVGPILSTGPATVPLTSAGEHYFICTITGHCSLNQKVAITVAAGPSSPTQSPVPGDSQEGPAPSPTAGDQPGSSPPSGGGPPTSMLGIAVGAAAGVIMAVALW